MTVEPGRGRLDIDLLHTFVKVSETGSISRSAAAVGRTQSAVSMQMRRLEETLGVTLLRRARSGVELTSAGDRLLAHAEKILRAHDEAVADVTGLQAPQVMSIGVSDCLEALLEPMLRWEPLLRRPQARLDVTLASSSQLARKFERGELDAAVLTRERHSDVGVVALEPLVWMAARGGEAALGNPLPLALADPDGAEAAAAIEALEEAGRNYRIAYASSNLAAISALVAADLAIAPVPMRSVPKTHEATGPQAGLPGLPPVAVVVLARSREAHATGQLHALLARELALAHVREEVVAGMEAK